jgi:hypothetical protein
MLMLLYLPDEYAFELEIMYLNRTTCPTILHFLKKYCKLLLVFYGVFTLTWLPPDIFS